MVTYFGPSKFLLTCCITTPCVYVTQSFHDNNIILYIIYCIHSYDMQSACFRVLGANLGKHKKKYIEILEDPRPATSCFAMCRSLFELHLLRAEDAFCARLAAASSSIGSPATSCFAIYRSLFNLFELHLLRMDTWLRQRT